MRGVEGRRVEVRFAEPGGRDPDAIAGIYAPFVRDTTVSFELEPPSAATIAERIASVRAFHPWLVLELDEVVVAYAYATRLRGRAAYDWIAETSIYVAPAVEARGLGRRLYTALLDLLALQGMVWAYGVIALPNPASQAFHARLGFEHLARFPAVGFKHQQWCDIDWWRKPLRTLADAHEPPRAIDDPAIAEAVQARLRLV